MNQVVSPAHPSFTPNAGIKKMPLVRKVAVALQSMYVNRGGTPEARLKLCDEIAARQKGTEVDLSGLPPLSIFAEATTTNGDFMIPFKRGAFLGMRTITPSFF